MSSSSISSSSFLEEFPELSYFGKTLNGTNVLVYNGSLYYKKQNQNVIKFCDNVRKVEVYRSNIVLLYNQNNWTESLDLIVLNENFTDSKKVYVKDKAFDVDDVNNYLKYSNRKIKDFYITNNELFVLFDGIVSDLSSSSVSLQSFSSNSSSSSSISSSSLSSDSSSSESSSSESSTSSSSTSSSSLSSPSSLSSLSSRSTSSSSNSTSSSSSSSISSSSSQPLIGSSSSSSSFSAVIMVLGAPNDNAIGGGQYYIGIGLSQLFSSSSSSSSSGYQNLILGAPEGIDIVVESFDIGVGFL